MSSRAASAPLLLVLLAALVSGCGDRMPIRGGEQQTRAATGAAELAADEVDLATFGYGHGAADAPVVVLEFSDFGCPYCARFALETLPEIEREFIETGQVRWQYVPFVMGMFPNGEEAARAAECAGEQERFWEMHDLVYQRQREWRAATSARAEPLFQRYAADLGLEAGAFATCFGENHPAGRIETSNRVAAELGIQSTPTFFINGRLVQGALPLDQFRMLLQWAGAVSPEAESPDAPT
jgi:protein-disulfide isomerase